MERFESLMLKVGSEFPTQISRKELSNWFSPDEIQWLFENNYVAKITAASYGLYDEFLRIRILMDQQDKHEDDVEHELLYPGEIVDLDFDDEQEQALSEYLTDQFYASGEVADDDKNDEKENRDD